MTKSAENILEQAMALEPDDRMELVDKLSESLEISTDPQYIAEWEAEIARRIEQVERGEVTPIPWREAIKQLGSDKDDAE